ncbi:MAG TPA: PAS domain S-box protein [bacterium]|nr:PAS domain S-box protein [bacterium]
MSLDFSITTAMVASGLASAVLALALWYLSTVPDAPDVTRWWAAGFLINMLRHVVGLCGAWLDADLCAMLAHSAQAICGLLLLAGTLRYAGRAGRQGWLLLAVPMVVVWAAAFTLVRPNFLLLTVPLYGLTGLAMLYSGWVFLRDRPAYARSGHLVVGLALVLWGLHKFDYPLLRPVAWFAPLGFILAEVLTLVVAVSLIIIVQRRQQHDGEQARKRAQASEARLQASEARYRDLVENNVQGVMIHRDGAPLYVNPAFLHMFGFAGWDELRSVDMLEAIADPSEVERLRRYTASRMRGQEAPGRYEYLGRRQDGTTIWVENMVRVIEWEGQPAIQATVFDITEQRHFEEVLRTNQRLLRTVIDSVPHTIIVRDREGRMLMANRAWEEVFGEDPGAHIGERSQEQGVYVTQEAESIHRISLAVIASEQPTSHEHDLTTQHGKRRFHTIRTPLRGEEHDVVGVVSISLDITEQRTMEEQLRQAQKMEAVGQLTGGVAHDFNNLLSVIMGNLELLEARVGADVRAASYTQRAMKASERGAALTQRLLAFSRRQTLQPRPVNLQRQVQDLLDLLRSSVGETVQIETRCDPRAGDVQVDPNQLENALLNLAINARDAMPGGGRLSIEVEPADAESVPGLSVEAGDWVVLTVRDTGTGMPQSVLGRAVEPFFTTKDPGSGSGLGLSMVYGFMDQSGGHMTIESRENEGTTVYLYFRRTETPVEGVVSSARPDVLRSGLAETVLVVEDDPALGHLAVEMLGELNYTAIRAMDGQEALQALRDNPQVGLLFTDVVLPNGMDGVMLAGEARRLRPGLKVLFTSGYAETVFERHPVDLEGAELVQKPYRLADLAHKLSRVLGPQAPLPA